MPCRRRESENAIKSTAEEFGAAVEIIRQNGHSKALLTLAGKTRAYFFSGSPSDGNTHKNVMRGVRRLLTEMATGTARAVSHPPSQRA